MNRISIILMFSLFHLSFSQKVNGSSIQKGQYFGLKYAEDILDVDKGLGPLHLNSNYQKRIGELIYSRLWRYNNRLQLEPDILQKMPDPIIIKGKEAFLCELKDNLKWSDGEDITVDDIIFSFEFYKKNTRPSLKINKLVSEIQIEKINSKSFYIIGERENFHYYANINIPLIQILPKHSIQTLIYYPNDDIWKEPLSSGPFKINSILREEKKTEIFFDRNEYALKSNPNWAIQKVIAVSESNPTQLIEGMKVSNKNSFVFKNKEPQFVGLDLLLKGVRSRSNINELNRARHIKRQQYAHHSWVGIVFNHDKPFLNSVEFRKTFDLAIDDQSMIDEFYQKGSAIDLTGPFNPFLGVTEKIKDRTTDNPNEVINSLESQGFKINQDNILEYIDQSNGDKTKVVLKLIYKKVFAADGTPERMFLNKIVEDFSINYGIILEIDGLSGINFNKKFKKRRDEWDLALAEFHFGWSGDITPLFFKESKNNFSNYSSNILEQDLNLLLTTNSSIGRAEIIKRIHRHCHENLPYLFLWHIRPVAYYRDVIQNPTFTPEYFFTTIGNWGVKPR